MAEGNCKKVVFFSGLFAVKKRGMLTFLEEVDDTLWGSPVHYLFIYWRKMRKMKNNKIMRNLKSEIWCECGWLTTVAIKRVSTLVDDGWILFSLSSVFAFCFFLTHSTHSSRTRTLTHALARELTRSHTHPLTHSSTHALIHSRTQSRTHARTHVASTLHPLREKLRALPASERSTGRYMVERRCVCVCCLSWGVAVCMLQGEASQGTFVTVFFFFVRTSGLALMFASLAARCFLLAKTMLD